MFDMKMRTSESRATTVFLMLTTECNDTSDEEIITLNAMALEAWPIVVNAINATHGCSMQPLPSIAVSPTTPMEFFCWRGGRGHKGGQRPRATAMRH